MTHVLGGVLPSDEAPGVPPVVVTVQGHRQADVEGGRAVGEAAVGDGLAADDAVRDGKEGGQRLEEQQAPHGPEKIPVNYRQYRLE